MDIVPTVPRKPVVAIAGNHEWLVRSLESIFGSSGFTVVARVGGDAAEWLPATRPDLVVLESGELEFGWKDQLKAIRGMRGITRATPIIAATSESLTRARRVEAIRAGAWDVFGHPLDAELLVMKANTFVAAKLEEEEIRDQSLIDPETDFYNIRGVLRRIYEEASEAARTHSPLACLVTSMEAGPTEPLAPGRARALARAFKEASRTSDVFGRLGPTEFVVLAPGTDSPGARIFAKRLVDIAGRGSEGDAGSSGQPLRAGFSAISDLADSTVEPVDLFVHAVAALRSAQASETADAICSYD